jgi:hypothetical protein
MDIEQFAYKVIEKIKALPPEAKQTGPDSHLKTVWDEFKEQMQYEEYDSFSLYEDMIEATVRDIVAEEDDYDVEILHYFFNWKQYVKASTFEKREDIIASIIYQIRIIAQVEEIEYKKNFEYIMYKDVDFDENGLIIVAKVIKRIAPYVYIVHGYSHNSVPKGNQVLVDISILDEESGLHIITSEQFERIKEDFNKVRKDILAACNRRQKFLRKQEMEL